MNPFRHERVAVMGLAVAAAACLDQMSPAARPLMEVSPPWAVFGPGDTLRLSALLTDSLGPAVIAQWTSTVPDVAQVDSTGLVRAAATGVTTITARRGDRTAKTTVAVVPPVLVGAGDIADCALQGDEATAAIVRAIPGFVFAAGDNAYQNGSASDYASCYDPSWGQFRIRTRPAPGNHEYHTPAATGYFDYFKAMAGPRGLGYYSYRAGTWHVVALNSGIPMDATSAQLAWLQQDLGANPTYCTAAYWHYPLFSSGDHGNVTNVRPAWDALYAAGADVIIVGHEHIYERFAPQSPDGSADSAAGVRQFTVGTGGGLLTTGVESHAATSERVITGRYGVLKLVLGDSTYRWEFLTAPGGQVADSGTGRCH